MDSNKGGGIVVISYMETKKSFGKEDSSSVNNGGLPSNTINSIAEDLDGAIWIGTQMELGYFFPNNIFDEKYYL